MPAARDRATRPQRGRRDAGAVVVWLALGLTTFLGLCGFAVDVGNWFFQGLKLQKAADAASLSGVVSLPGDPATAGSTARAVSAQNGYVDGSGGVVVKACPGQTTSCAAALTPSLPTQLEVSVSRNVPSFFARLVGVGSFTITRRAVAEYEQPLSLGSPANIFGNEPVSSALGETAWSNAPTFNPQLWGNVKGPQSTKGTGDALQAIKCAAGAAQNCGGGVNLDYNLDGYLYAVTVDRSAHPGQSLQIQVFDPAAVHVGDHCDDTASNLMLAAGKVNPYTNAADSAVRYRWGDTQTNPGSPAQMPGVFCTGDNNDEAVGRAPTTTYVVRRYMSPTGGAAANPPVASGACQGVQYQGYGQGTVDLSKALDQSNPGYNDALAKVFRQWVSTCTFTPDAYPAGAYLIQIRTNVVAGATQAQMAGPGDSTIDTGGSNRFSIRASWFSGAGRVSSPDVTVAGLGSMGLYANARAGDPAPNFYTARVLPGAAGETLEVRLWDIGDCGAGCTPGSVVLTFRLANGSSTTCSVGYHWPKQYSVPIGSSCTFPATSPSGAYDGNNDYIVVDMPIPKGYTCNPQVASDCWATMSYATSTGALNDTTTWAAEMLGNPARLIL